MADEIPIGELRWRVAIFKREQVPDLQSMGISETLKPLASPMAKIEASRPGTFYGSVQVDTPVTHMIWIRWMRGIDNRHVIVRDTEGPDGEAIREIFRIRRELPLGGRKRFLMFEAELERHPS